MGDLKQSKQALGAEVLSSVSEWTAPTLMGLAVRLAFGNRASNLVVTNVPGPQVPLYLLGARMLESYPVAPLFRNQGLALALFSYGGGLYWGFNADWDRFPDLHDFVLAVDASFRELCEAADAEEPGDAEGDVPA
jgi:diacylglycerol O-acyltransferase